MPGKRDVFQQKYIGKDCIIMGSALILDKDLALGKISRRARRAIKKAQELKNFKIKKIKGTIKEINQFREIWYYPEDPDLGDEGLTEKQHGWFGYLDGELIAGTIVTEVGSNIFLHFNGATDGAKKMQIPSLMIWNVVLEFNHTKFKYLDIGCSFRPGLQEYFKNWATYEYPIILHAPDLTPQIDITPFDTQSLGVDTDLNVDVDKVLSEKFCGKPFTYFPRGKYAIFALLKYLGLKNDDEVFITTTTGSPYLSIGVSTTIEEVCKWSRKISNNTKAVLLIHEFGFLHPNKDKIRSMCNDNDWTLIEDCAWAWDCDNMGSDGDYKIYSLPKYFPVQYGGLLVGKYFTDQEIWNNYYCLDVQKRNVIKNQLSSYILNTDYIKKKRNENYHYLLHLFQEEGLEPFFELNDGDVPAALFIKVESHEKMIEIRDSLKHFGIECGAYHHNNAVFLPVHQNLNKNHMDYIFGSMRSLFRENCGVYPPEYFLEITKTKMDRNDHPEDGWIPPPGS